MPRPQSRRPSAAKRGYDSKWAKARIEHLRQEPHCRSCLRRGRTVEASHVDHIVPHRRDWKLFWDRKNWQSLCTTCHNSAKQSAEATGFQRGCDEDGVPLDPGHHWQGDRA